MHPLTSCLHYTSLYDGDGRQTGFFYLFIFSSQRTQCCGYLYHGLLYLVFAYFSVRLYLCSSTHTATLFKPVRCRNGHTTQNIVLHDISYSKRSRDGRMGISILITRSEITIGCPLQSPSEAIVTQPSCTCKPSNLSIVTLRTARWTLGHSYGCQWTNKTVGHQLRQGFSSPLPSYKVTAVTSKSLKVRVRK